MLTQESSTREINGPEKQIILTSLLNLRTEYILCQQKWIIRVFYCLEYFLVAGSFILAITDLIYRNIFFQTSRVKSEIENYF